MMDKMMLKIKEQNPNYSNDDLAMIKYGLSGLYLSLTKVVVILLLSYFLGIFYQVLYFVILFGLMRSNAFGLHASNSLICLITSTLYLVGLPLLAIYLNIPNYIKIIVGLLATIYIYHYAPADTRKKPIISPIKRRRHKIVSTITAISFLIMSIYINNSYISNSCFLCVLAICPVISPSVYKLFKLPYNNYLNYVRKEAIE